MRIYSNGISLGIETDHGTATIYYDGCSLVIENEQVITSAGMSLDTALCMYFDTTDSNEVKRRYPGLIERIRKRQINTNITVFPHGDKAL